MRQGSGALRRRYARLDWSRILSGDFASPSVFFHSAVAVRPLDFASAMRLAGRVTLFRPPSRWRFRISANIARTSPANFAAWAARIERISAITGSVFIVAPPSILPAYISPALRNHGIGKPNQSRAGTPHWRYACSSRLADSPSRRSILFNNME